MTDTSTTAPTGGSWIREPDGTLVRAEEPTRRPAPHDPAEPQAPEPEAAAPKRGRAAPLSPEA